jgi:hypothetical protein
LTLPPVTCEVPAASMALIAGMPLVMPEGNWVAAVTTLIVRAVPVVTVLCALTEALTVSGAVPCP